MGVAPRTMFVRLTPRINTLNSWSPHFHSCNLNCVLWVSGVIEVLNIFIHKINVQLHVFVFNLKLYSFFAIAHICIYLNLFDWLETHKNKYETHLKAYKTRLLYERKSIYIVIKKLFDFNSIWRVGICWHKDKKKSLRRLNVWT